jgi:hypothetical protein
MELGQRHLSAVAGIFDNLTQSSGLRGAIGTCRRDTPIWKLESAFRCRSCGTPRYKAAGPHDQADKGTEDHSSPFANNHLGKHRVSRRNGLNPIMRFFREFRTNFLPFEIGHNSRFGPVNANCLLWRVKDWQWDDPHGSDGNPFLLPDTRSHGAPNWVGYIPIKNSGLLCLLVSAVVGVCPLLDEQRKTFARIELFRF